MLSFHAKNNAVIKSSAAGTLTKSLTTHFIIALLFVIPFNTTAQTSNKFTIDDFLDVSNISTVDLSRDGKWIVATSGTLRDRIGINNYRFGDPTYLFQPPLDVIVINTETGKSQKLFSSKQAVRPVMKWSPDGTQLAFTQVKNDLLIPMLWDRVSGKIITLKIPEDRIVANSQFEWTRDGTELLFFLRDKSWQQKAAERFKYETTGPIVVYSSKEPYLSWDSTRRLALPKSLVAYNVKNATLRQILPESKVNWFGISGDGSFLIVAEDITSKTDYDAIGGAENKISVVPTAGGERRVIIKSTKTTNPHWSEDYRRYAYVKDGNIFIASVEDKEAKQLTGKTDSSKLKMATDSLKSDTSSKAKKESEKFNLVRLSPKGDRLVVTTKEGMWLMNGTTGEREIIVKMPEEDKEGPRYQLLEWSPDANMLYLNYASRTQWERGLFRYDASSKKLEQLIRDSLLYSGMQLSKNGQTFVFNSSRGNNIGDIYTADAGFKKITRLTEVNPQLKSKQLSKTRLISYYDADGNKMYGVLYLPVDYEAGKKYPTIFILYEQFFDDNYSGTVNILTTNGYAVMQPSVTLETGFPGEAWIKGATSAANKLVEMGIADPERLGVHGTSYGGYATNLLITQTNRFKAAINISGKVNMISFYTGSPRLGTRNIHAPEKSQDRIGATLWQQPQKYIQHSAIMFADRIKTPLLLISGGQDHNVPAEQSREMFYALRRLGKEVEWVNYVNGGHGLPTTTVEEVKDFHKRIIDWYDTYLKKAEKKNNEVTKTDAG